MLPAAMARSSNHNAICYILPILWMTSHFHTVGHMWCMARIIAELWRRTMHCACTEGELLDCLFMAALWNRAGHYISALWFLSFFFFPCLSQQPQIGCLPYFDTWCGLSANLQRRSENVLHAARWKYRTKKSPFWHHRTTFSGYIFGTKACIDNRKKTC